VDGVQEFEEERKRIEGAIAEADRIFNDASARHDATVDPLDIRLKQIKTLTSEADLARQELYSTCPNADLVSRLEEIARPLDQAKRRLGSAETQGCNLRNQAKAERADAELCVREPNAEAHVKGAENCDAQARELERELRGLRRQVVDLERQDAEIRERLLVP
jgi:chromosome segregation ATPase